MTLHDHCIVNNYAIRVYENVDCIYIAEVNEPNSYFMGFDRDHGCFIPAGCHKQFLHIICQEADDI
jgi:hypothetical protein